MICVAVQCAALALFLAGAASFGVLLKGCYVLRRRARQGAGDIGTYLLKSPLTPMVSVVAVASDISPQTHSFVRRLLDLQFSRHEVVLVLDGPSDQDFEKWTAGFRLLPRGGGMWESVELLRLIVVRTERAGAPAAYNAGVSAATGSILAFFDPAGEFVSDALLRLIPPMLQDPAETAACGIAPEILAGSLVQRFGAIESLRLWLGRCAAFAGWNMLLPVQGCCLLVRRDAIQEAGGFPASSGRQPDSAALLGLILRLHGRARAGGPPFRMALVPDPISHTPAARSMDELRQIVFQDQQALKGAIRYRNSVARGILAIGWGLPALLSDRLLRPVLETALYLVTVIGIAMGLLPLRVGLLVLLCTVVTGILVSMSAVVLRELAEFRGSDPRQLASLFFAAIPENLGYRQLRNLWLVEGFLKSKTR